MRKTLVVTATILLATNGGHLAGPVAAQTDGTRSVRDGVYTEEQVERGVLTYDQICSDCHGYDLEGGEEAPELEGGTFLSNWNGLTLRDLADRIRTTMPPDDARSISRQQASDITSLILNANNFPAGDDELGAATETLRQIKIDAFGGGR
jgi:mono/diheme cytochrome c family protein